MVRVGGDIGGIELEAGDTIAVNGNDWVYQSDGTLEGPELSTDGLNITNGPITWSPDDGALLEGLQQISIGNNGEFGNMFLGELKLLPSENGTFGSTDFSDINGATDDTPAGVSIIGTGMQASTPIVGSGDHALNLSTNDASARYLSVRQEDSSGSYDAVHVSEREARVENIGIDGSPRSGVRVTATRAILSELEVTGGDSEAIYVDSSDCVINSTIMQTPVGAGLRTSSGSEGLNASDLRIDSSASDASYILDIGGELHNISGVFGGASITIPGNRVHLDGSYYVSPEFGFDISGNKNTISGLIDGGTDAEVVISGSDNHITGVIDINVIFESGSSNNDLSNAHIIGSVTNNAGDGTNGGNGNVW